MTPRQLLIVEALSRVSLPFGVFGTRSFIKSIARLAANEASKPLSPRQVAYMLSLSHRYRRQIHARVLELVLDEAEQLTELSPDSLDRRGGRERRCGR